MADVQKYKLTPVLLIDKLCGLYILIKSFFFYCACRHNYH